MVKEEKNYEISVADDDFYFVLGWTCLHYAAALGSWKPLAFLASLSHCNVNARTHLGLKAQECPETEFFRKKCKWIIQGNRLTKKSTLKKIVV
jgi:hypothetical protein